MEIFHTECDFVLLCGESSLWIDKKTAEFSVKPAWEIANGHDPECLGICFGLVGCIRCPNFIDDHVIFVKESILVGELPSGHAIHKIKSIALLNPTLEVKPDLGLKRCPKHHRSADSSGEQQNLTNSAISKTWSSLKTATTNIKSTAQQTSSLQGIGKGPNEVKQKERYQRRIIDEVHRIFTDTDSFYFCPAGGDITNSVHRQYQLENDSSEDNIFNRIDDRFFWNRHLLQDIIKLDSPLARVWIMPIVQGYVEIKDCKLDLGDNQNPEVFTISLISRRSRHRVGTRYKRRGVDIHGHCANYVETEQIVKYKKHVASFTQIRGSIPLYWSQQGYKYRPPPQLHKSFDENQTALTKHITGEIERYGIPTVIVNLVERCGKEAVIGDAYADHICSFNDPDITYVTFDFHHYCHGLRYENVSLLITELQDEIAKMGYCWIDNHGLISRQNGVFRVNCVDCLDRTNVVQTAIAREVLIVQLVKLGLMTPGVPNSLFAMTQQMWANNGDIISKQYAGTNALKGDITRTGGRKFTGMMKDGMNSASRYFRNYYADYYTQICLDLMQGNDLNGGKDFIVSFIDNVAVPFVDQFTIPLCPRTYSTSDFALMNELRSVEFIYLASRYYLSRFKDTNRQATLDIMLGNSLEENIHQKDSSSSEEDDVDGSINEEEKLSTIDHIKQVIEDVKKLLIADPSFILTAWGLIAVDYQNEETVDTDMDTILVLTHGSYFVAEYDTELDKVIKFEEVHLKQVKLLEVIIWNNANKGPTVASNNDGIISKKRSPRKNYSLSPTLNIHYVTSESGDQMQLHNFWSTNVRFFNNIAVPIKSDEEKIESLKAIAETIQATCEVCGFNDVEYNVKVVQRKSSLLSPETYSSFKPSELQLSSLKNVGSKALSNVSQQFNKINDFSKSFKFSKIKLQSALKKDSANAADVVTTKPQETFLSTAGIVLSNTYIRRPDVVETTSAQQRPSLPTDHSATTPDIVVNNSDNSSSASNVNNASSTTTTLINQSATTSSSSCGQLSAGGNIVPPPPPIHKSVSDKNLSLNLPLSPSDSAYQSLKSGFANATSSIIHPSSPLSRLAKGVQSLGQNLDPRKLKQHGQTVTAAESSDSVYSSVFENVALKEKWDNAQCKSKLIPL